MKAKRWWRERGNIEMDRERESIWECVGEYKRRKE